MEYSKQFAYEELRLLSLLLETEQLSLAALRLNISVSTASRQLARARAIVGDPLFVRAKAGLVPTSRMLAISGKLDALLDAWNALLESESAFSPEHLARTFHVMAADNGLNAYINAAIVPIQLAAPGVKLVIEPLAPDFWRALRSGAVDAVIYPEANVPAECRSIALTPMRPILIMRPGHPLIERYRAQGDLSKAEIAEYPLVIADPRVGMLFEDLVASQAEVAAVVLPYFNAVKPILERSDFVSWVPEASARDWIASGRLVGIYPSCPPFKTFTPRLIWHERTHADPACQWLRGMILRHSGPLEGEVDAESTH